MTTCLGKSCLIGLLCMPFLNCFQFMNIIFNLEIYLFLAKSPMVSFVFSLLLRMYTVTRENEKHFAA